MINKLKKLAAELKNKGFKKYAADLYDLTERRKKQQDHNKPILDKLREEDRLKEIERQHQQDKREFKMTQPESAYEAAPESKEDTNPSRRYKVHVSYPNFDEAGAPYFDKTSVSEFLSMTAKELENYKLQQEKGYLKIHSAQPLLPKSK